MEFRDCRNHCKPNSGPLVKFTCDVFPGGRLLALNTTPPTAAMYGETVLPAVKFHLAMKGLIAPAYWELPWIQNSFRGTMSTAISKLPRNAFWPISCESTRPIRAPATNVCALGEAANEVLPPR